jgi:hypothetical protein
MKLTSFSLSLGKTVAIADYENIKVHVDATISLEENSDFEEERLLLSKTLRTVLEEEIDKLRPQEYRVRRKRPSQNYEED